MKNEAQGREAEGAAADDEGRVASAPQLVAALVSMVEAVALAAVAVAYVLELVRGEATESGVAVMSLVVTTIFTVLLTVMATAWWRGQPWPRTPTIVWNALLLPVAWTLNTTNGLAVSLPVALLALVGIGAALASPSRDLLGDES